jgi:hypothetical protein
MNTEATDDASLNSGRNRNKSKPTAVIYNDPPTITLHDAKTPDSKGGRTISYNNELDHYSKSRNEDAITCKRDCSKYANLSDTDVGKGGYIKNIENIFDGNQIGSLEEKGDQSAHFNVVSSYTKYFEQAGAPLEGIARSNPSLVPLLKLIRKGYEDV